MRSFVAGLVICMLAGAAEAAAQTQSFRLVDARTGAPIAGADVSVLGQTGATRTDREGRFSWTPAPRPPFEILVILNDGTLAKPVLVEAIEGPETLLRLDAAVAEQVTVSGAAPTIDASPAAGMTSISGRDISVRQPENLIAALENVAGVNQQSEGHAGVPAVRGLAAGRTLILIDGARVTTERRVGPSATYLDPAVLDGVEIARGPGSVAYGSDAIGGVIAARTRRVEAGAPLTARALGTIGVGVPEQRLSVEFGRGFSGTGVFAQAHVRNAEDYDSPEGEVFNSGWQDGGVLARTTHLVGPGHLSVGWQSDFARDLERPRNNSRSTRFFYPVDDSHRFTVNYRQADAGAFGSLSIDTLVASYTNITDQDSFATADQPRTVERADVRAKDYQVRAVAERLLGNARLMTGVDVNGRFDLDALDIYEDYDLPGALVATRENVSTDGASKRDLGLFVQVDAAAGPALLLSGGGRFDYVTTNNPGGYFGDRSTSNSAFSGFAAATAGPFDGVTVTGQVSRGFRDPVLSDRYYRGPTGRGFITGNPDLDPETSLQFDAAVRYTTGRYRIGVNAYHYDIDNLIERYETAGDNFFFRNRGQARVKGLELEAQAVLPADVALELTGQVMRGETPEDGVSLEGITPATVSVVARKLFGARGFAQTRVAWFAEDDNPGPGEREVNGYTRVDLAGGVRLVRQLELRAQARNLFDATYFATQASRAVLAPGRALALTAVVSY